MPGNPKFDPFHEVKIVPKFEKSTERDHKLISSEDDQDASACKISGHSLHAFSGTKMPGNLCGRTDGQTWRKMVTVGRMDKRSHVQVERGYFRLQTDERTDERTNRKHNTSGAQRCKKPYHRNRWANRHESEGIWINRKWNTLCGFEIWPLPWPWPWILKVKFWKSHIATVYDFKYFQGLPFGLFEFEDL